MTMGIAIAVVLLIGVGVVWALGRFMREISRYEEWDSPVVKQKREGWK